MSDGNDIEFLAFHRPQLTDGNYRLRIDQRIKWNATNPIAQRYPQKEAAYQATQTFTVAGPRYRLDEPDIIALFPPPNSSGDHSNVLPHVVLRRSTLPWERQAEAEKEALPWLTVLLFDEAEAPLPRLSDVKTLYADQSASFPSRDQLEREPGEHDDDKVTVIEVPADLLRRIAPTGDELPWLAHVRQWDAADGPEQQAIVLGNRLPRPGHASVAHLVSLESRYKDGRLDFPASSPVRLVSLKSWRFSCLDPNKSFKNLLLELNRGLLRLAPPPVALPAPAAEILRHYQQHGYLLLPHHLRNGQTTASWYHGPLVGGPNDGTLPLPARTPDALLRFDSASGRYDISYAAAWELGRLLALQDGQFALDLYHWKRAHARQQQALEAQLDHLPFKRLERVPDLPQSIGSWLHRLALLVGVPFDYLVPDERLLPPESIRFFQIDPLWVAALLDGAFAVGRVLDSDYTHDQAHYGDADTLYHWAKPADDSTVVAAAGEISGFLLRSEVVAGWPQLQIDGYETLHFESEMPALEERLPILRLERLAPNLLFGLFDGRILTLDIHQKPESLHAGVSEADDRHPDGYYKVRRQTSGNHAGVETGETVRVPFRGDKDGRVLAIAGLAQTLGAQSAADFALQMVEGVPLVRFILLEMGEPGG